MMSGHKTRAARITSVIAAGTMVFGVSACDNDDDVDVENEFEDEIEDEVESELQNP